MKGLYGILIVLVLILLIGLGVFYMIASPFEYAGDEPVIAESTGSGSRSSSKGSASDDILSPEETVDLALSSLMEGDMETFKSLINTTDSDIINSITNDLDSDSSLRELYSEMEYELTDVDIDDDIAYVHVVISSYDTSGIYDELDENSSLEQAIGGFVEDVIGTFSTGEADLCLTKSSGQWKLEVDESLIKILTGGSVANWFNN